MNFFVVVNCWQKNHNTRNTALNKHKTNVSYTRDLIKYQSVSNIDVYSKNFSSSFNKYQVDMELSWVLRKTGYKITVSTIVNLICLYNWKFIMIDWYLLSSHGSGHIFTGIFSWIDICHRSFYSSICRPQKTAHCVRQLEIRLNLNWTIIEIDW